MAPRLPWNEIAARAERFAAEWEGETYEAGESQSFWADFLDIFGIHRRRAGGYFEYAVKLNGGRSGRIDMLLPGRILAEQKSAGRDLGRATAQALSYLDGLDDHDLPKLIVASDFRSFTVLDLDTREAVDFPLEDLHKHVQLFAPIYGEVRTTIEEQLPVNRQAAERIGALHHELLEAGYRGHDLAMLMVRLVFCLFAEDAGIFEPGQFREFVKTRTSEGGSDLGPLLAQLFEVLDTAPEDRARALDSDLAAFKHVNGGLFHDRIATPSFDAPLRLRLLDATRVDWALVSPAIFGAMFQAVLEDEDGSTRHDFGAHYTSEENILRAVKPLFLDDLYAEFERANALGAKARITALESLHDKLASLRFLDPACGCGNFLVITYRELRRLEHRIVEAVLPHTTLFDVSELLRVRVEQMAGIEIIDSAALIAKTALWLTDHQMNREASLRLGTTYARLPLTDGANIITGNALTTDWNEAAPAESLNFIIGNPPFLGSRIMDAEQKAQLREVAAGYPTPGFLDFVAGWYILADRMMEQNPSIEVALVSTNSLSQGEQPAIIWPKLYEHGADIKFAHRTFQWTNDARNVAHVHVIIVGFTRKRLTGPRQLFIYPDIKGEPVLELVRNISPYLVEGPRYVVGNHNEQVSGGPKMAFGNMAADGGDLLLKPVEREALLAAEPAASEWVLPFIGAQEMLQGSKRYALWLDGIEPGELRALPQVSARVAKVRATRLKSSRPKLADTPHLFAQRTIDPRLPMLVIPRVSSESREYVPMQFFNGGVVVSDACVAVPDAQPWLFGLLTSKMHMAWLGTVGGRLKSDYRYSADLVYANFVFPSLSAERRDALGALAQAVLDARADHPASTLDALYADATMPADLRHAHAAIDAFVDELYKAGGFADDSERVNHLLELRARV